MNFATRAAIYRDIEADRKSKVIAFMTSDRVNAETQIAQDAIAMFIEFLDAAGPVPKISLILTTNGGDTAAAWRLINLIRSFCDELEVLIPMKAMSAGTLISLGANRIVMTKQAVLGPIDPSLTHPLGPAVPIGNQMAQIPVSVEAVRGYLDAAEKMKITDAHALASVLVDLSNKIHPLVLGAIFRSREQIRFLASKLLREHMQDTDKEKAIIDFLCADSGSHDYTINRREAATLGLPIEKPSAELYEKLRMVYGSAAEEMKLLQPFNPVVELGARAAHDYAINRGIIESADGGCYAFMSEGQLKRLQVPNPAEPSGFSIIVNDERTFEGWKKI